MVREHLDDSELDERTIGKIVKASWVIAKCRMSNLPDDGAEASDEEGTEGEAPSTGTDAAADQQPGAAVAERIAKAMTSLALSEDQDDKKNFKELTKGASPEEKAQMKEDAPEKPKKMDDFMEALRKALRCNAVDFALFGRMTTSDAFEDVEAAMQVAHAISTHAVVNEVDYWTAVDDLGKSGGGSGHLGEGMYNSACFYKYFCLDWDQLVSNLAGPEPKRPDNKKDDSEEVKKWQADLDKWTKKVKQPAARLAACALGHFIRAAAMTTPSGKQNSFASHTEPCGILVEIKKNGKHPTNYANAFAEPVERIGRPDDDAPDEKSIEGRSVACLADHVHAIRSAYGIDSTLLWYSPKVWRFPFQYWERNGNGKKMTAKFVTDKRYDRLDGDSQSSLVEAVVDAIGLKWQEVKNAGKTEAPGATS
ncbi:MAG: type I-E CRISPR-associated protein Cas7/Cse4/CasC [Phycisphaerae bacterium]|nr:type I-E CRISPR-associated protein Cas7/Cse4/CasC [Phycisphaerae bacterium]